MRHLSLDWKKQEKRRKTKEIRRIKAWLARTDHATQINQKKKKSHQETYWKRIYLRKTAKHWAQLVGLKHMWILIMWGNKGYDVKRKIPIWVDKMTSGINVVDTMHLERKFPVASLSRKNSWMEKTRIMLST